MKAVGKYIIVNETEGKSSTTKGGLLLGSKQKEDIRYRQAEVLEIGTDVLDDNIYFDRHAGFDIELNDVIYKIIKEGDVVIVL
jgi:co-chaperonin GroES (HSP10)